MGYWIKALLKVANINVSSLTETLLHRVVCVFVFDLYIKLKKVDIVIVFFYFVIYLADKGLGSI